MKTPSFDKKDGDWNGEFFKKHGSFEKTRNFNENSVLWSFEWGILTI